MESGTLYRSAYGDQTIKVLPILVKLTETIVNNRRLVRYANSNTPAEWIPENLLHKGLPGFDGDLNA